MRALVIGGTRFIGVEIVKQMVSAGHEVILFNRGTSSNPTTCSLIQGDIQNFVSYRSEILETNPDVVIHCIAYTEKHAEDCVEVFKGSDAHIVVLSSMDCYDSFQAVVRGKESSDFPVDELMPTTTIQHYWKGSSHEGNEDYDKNLMTNVFQEAFTKGWIQSTILRLPMVYGPNDYQFENRHGSIIRRILDKRREYVISSLEQGQIATHGYIVNIGAAVVHACGNPTVIGNIYNVGETKVRTRRRWAELYAKASGWEFEFEVVPPEILTNNPSYRNRPAQVLIYDCSLFQNHTHFENPFSLEEGILKTFEYGQRFPDRLGLIPNYEKEADLVAQYRRSIDGIVITA
jgi:nucleoside-diphosphate-sugar epimerase